MSGRWSFEPPDGRWKHGALSQLLYEEALRPDPFAALFGPTPPPTRRQRWRWRLANYRSRVVRAARVLAGHDDEE